MGIKVDLNRCFEKYWLLLFNCNAHVFKFKTIPEAYWEPCQAFKMDCFDRVLNTPLNLIEIQKHWNSNDLFFVMFNSIIFGQYGN